MFAIRFREKPLFGAIIGASPASSRLLAPLQMSAFREYEIMVWEVLARNYVYLTANSVNGTPFSRQHALVKTLLHGCYKRDLTNIPSEEHNRMTPVPLICSGSLSGDSYRLEYSILGWEGIERHATTAAAISSNFFLTIGTGILSWVITEARHPCFFREPVIWRQRGVSAGSYGYRPAPREMETKTYSAFYYSIPKPNQLWHWARDGV
ncbi:hypothetical protein F4802DRAFT_546087 [Xylaria palmicola]|nr:hypothetical protein F4802DRAFT_546087 [Xylaria palmicola]